MYLQGTSRSCLRCGSTGHTCKSPDHPEEVWWGGHFRCDNVRCKFEGDRDYIGVLNVARVFFSDGDELDHGFTSSSTGDCETVLADRSASTRLTFGTGVVASEPGQARATAGGGSAVIAPTVALLESKNTGRDGHGSAVQQSPDSYGVLLKTGTIPSMFNGKNTPSAVAISARTRSPRLVRTRHRASLLRDRRRDGGVRGPASRAGGLRSRQVDGRWRSPRR